MASPHLRGHAFQHSKGKSSGVANKIEGAHAGNDDNREPGPHEHAPGAGVGEGHASEHGTKPHPVTGVHAVHIHHMGGGAVKTHTHHDGGRIESQGHASMDEAHQHAQEQLPPDMPHNEPDGDEPMAPAGDDDGSGMASSLGRMG